MYNTEPLLCHSRAAVDSRGLGIWDGANNCEGLPSLSSCKHNSQNKFMPTDKRMKQALRTSDVFDLTLNILHHQQFFHLSEQQTNWTGIRALQNCEIVSLSLPYLRSRTTGYCLLYPTVVLIIGIDSNGRKTSGDFPLQHLNLQNSRRSRWMAWKWCCPWPCIPCVIWPTCAQLV